MIIEVGEFLHTYIAVGMVVFISFLLGMQVGSSEKEHRKSS
ncbi:hypothetical protein [Planococcus koreensis]